MKMSFFANPFTAVASWWFLALVVFFPLVASAAAQNVALRILEPRDGAQLRLSASEIMPAERPIRGDVGGFTRKQIEELGLLVDVSIHTDRWYPQGIAAVRPDGTWALRKGYFGGAVHVIRAVLKDRHGNELASATATVTLIQ